MPRVKYKPDRGPWGNWRFLPQCAGTSGKQRSETFPLRAKKRLASNPGSGDSRGGGSRENSETRQPFVGNDGGLHPVTEQSLKQLVTDRLQGRQAIRVARGGRLAESEAGFPAGTPYVVIQVDNAANRDIARTLLRDFSGTSDLAWTFGWRAREGQHGRRVTELTLYAASS